jgi:hypothetical protein
VSRGTWFVLVAAILAPVVAPVVAVELWYRSLLPEVLPAPSRDPLPPLVRAALWVECRGTGEARVHPQYPFLLPAVIKIATEAVPDHDSGGTLLWQLARIHLSHEPMKHLRHRLRSMALATWISRHWSVEDALDAYGAWVWTGEDRRGLRAGAAHYFGRPLESLDAGEIALIVAITQSPSRLDPACSPERATAARNQLLERMSVAGALDAGVAARAAAEPLAVALDCNRLTGIPRASRRARS